MHKRILRRKQLCTEKLGCGLTKSYDFTNDPSFPRAVHLGGNICGWFEDEVDQWLEARPRLSNRHRLAATD